MRLFFIDWSPDYGHYGRVVRAESAEAARTMFLNESHSPEYRANLEKELNEIVEISADGPAGTVCEAGYME